VKLRFRCLPARNWSFRALALYGLQGYRSCLQEPGEHRIESVLLYNGILANSGGRFHKPIVYWNGSGGRGDRTPVPTETRGL